MGFQPSRNELANNKGLGRGVEDSRRRVGRHQSTTQAERAQSTNKKGTINKRSNYGPINVSYTQESVEGK